MRRVAIIGRSGGGKSTLARKLGAVIGAPVVHLDTLFWRPGWVESEREPFRARVAEALSGDAWVADGNFFTSIGDLNIGRADTIIWIDQPRLLCLGRAIRRVVFERGGRRPDMAAGCDEKLDLDFYAYIWNWDRDTRPRLQAAIEDYAPETPVVCLRRDAEIAAFLEGEALLEGCREMAADGTREREAAE